MKVHEIKLSISDKALATLKKLVFSSMLGENYGDCQNAWAKVINAIKEGKEAVELRAREERKAGN